MASIKLEQIIEKMKLINLTPELDLSKIKIKQPDINRPALQLAGYFEHFEATRLWGRFRRRDREKFIHVSFPVRYRHLFFAGSFGLMSFLWRLQWNIRFPC